MREKKKSFYVHKAEQRPYVHFFYLQSITDSKERKMSNENGQALLPLFQAWLQKGFSEGRAVVKNTQLRVTF